jgi:hypothetical protein
MPKATYAPHSDEAKGHALGAVIYEALLLALSLHLRRAREQSIEHVPNAGWNRERQIALELMVIKCRVLDDFITSFGDKTNDIHAGDFNYTPGPEYERLAVDFRDAVNKRTAHLTWTRVANAPLPDWDKVGGGAANHACDVLKETYRFIADIWDEACACKRTSMRATRQFCRLCIRRSADCLANAGVPALSTSGQRELRRLTAHAPDKRFRRGSAGRRHPPLAGGGT